MSVDPTEGEEAKRLHGQIERLRVAISDEEHALVEARVGRDYRSVSRVQADLANRRAYLAELLAEQLRRATRGGASESGA